MFRIKTVLDTVSGSDINIKEVIGNYECSSLARKLFETSGLQNHGVDGTPDLVHVVCNSTDSAWIDPWQGKVDVAVMIDAMRAIFHLPRSTKFESFLLLSSSFLNNMVKRNFIVIHSNHFV